jgi:hypothetical protein
MDHGKAERFRTVAIGLAVLLAIALPVQGWLGSDSFLKANETAKSAHVGLGNTLFLLSVVQVVLIWIFFRERARTAVDVAFAVALPIAIAAQMMLGFSGRKDPDLRIWHIALGVTLMGVATVFATRSFTRTGGSAT